MSIEFGQPESELPRAPSDTRRRFNRDAGGTEGDMDVTVEGNLDATEGDMDVTVEGNLDATEGDLDVREGWVVRLESDGWKLEIPSVERGVDAPETASPAKDSLADFKAKFQGVGAPKWTDDDYQRFRRSLGIDAPQTTPKVPRQGLLAGGDFRVVAIRTPATDNDDTPPFVKPDASASELDLREKLRLSAERLARLTNESQDPDLSKSLRTFYSQEIQRGRIEQRQLKQMVRLLLKDESPQPSCDLA